MDQAWVGVIGALGGVAIGALAEGWRARSLFRRDKRWQVQEEQRRRLEMVYEALEQLRQSYGDGVTSTMFAIRYGKAPERQRPTMEAPWARLRMLVHLYTPWLNTHLEGVSTAGKDVGASMAKGVMVQEGNPAHDEPYVDAMFNELAKLNAAIDAMTGEVVESVRTLDREVLQLVGGGKVIVNTPTGPEND